MKEMLTLCTKNVHTVSILHTIERSLYKQMMYSNSETVGKLQQQFTERKLTMIYI